MPSIIILHPGDKREVRYEAKEWEKDGIDSVVKTLFPIEIERIKKATPQEVQKLLRIHI
jgi:hypothetical protein